MRIDQMKRILLISFTDLISMPMWYADHERHIWWFRHTIPKAKKSNLIITIHMPQRTNKILLVRLTANRNAVLFVIRVTSFARYTV